ncbi:MAG TPA: hypothetical protein VGM43_22725, partial [Bryobacteraceae bacterium]
DWEGGALGVRLRYEPKDLKVLYKNFLGAFDDAMAIKAAAAEAWRKDAEGKESDGPPPKLTVWPVNGGAISGHGGGVKSGQLLSRRLKQKAPFAKGAFCFSALV